jgi:hypothetical protein
MKKLFPTLFLVLILMLPGCSDQPGSTPKTNKQTATTSIETLISPVDIPRKPESLAATDAEYFLIYITYQNWGWDFANRYNSSSSKYLADKSTSWWIGSTDDDNKRLNFERTDSQWRIKSLPPLPANTPPKPPTMGGSDADYYFLFSLYENWYGKGRFNSDYENGVKAAAENNWVVFWIGNGEDISKRAYFIQNGNQWVPRAFASMLLGAFNFIGQYPKPTHISYTNSNGESVSTPAYPGQVEVFFKSSITALDAENLIKANNGKILGQLPMLGYYLVGVAPGSEGSFITTMFNDNQVSSALPNLPVSASEEDAVINPDFLTSAKPVPLNVKPGVIALDYYLNETHGFHVNETVFKNGGTVGSSVEIGVEPGGVTTSDKVKMAIVAAAEGNRIFNPGEPTLFNLSTNHHINRDFDILPDEERQSLLSGWEDFTRSIAHTIAALPTDIKDNIALTNSAGNTRMPLTQPLANLRKDPIVQDILDKHLLFASTWLKGEQSVNYPWGDFSNLAPGDPDVAVLNNPEAKGGTSFASPAAAAIVQQVQNTAKVSLIYALKAAKLAIKNNAKHELILNEAIEKAEELKTAITPEPPSLSPTTPSVPVPNTTGATPSPTTNMPSNAAANIDSITCNLLNTRYDGNGYYWIEIQASGMVSGPVDSMVFLNGQAEPATNGWLPISTLDWTVLEQGRMAKRESNSPATTSWSTSGELPITWTQWHNFPNITFKLTVEVRQDEYSQPLVSTSKSIPLQQPDQAK